MSSEKPRFLNVDDLVPQVSLEQAAAFYGVSLPELKQVGDTVRTKCFLNCGRTGETGDRALSIKADDPKRTWKCHAYGCPHGGNLVSLCDLMKPGPHMDGKPRGGSDSNRSSRTSGQWSRACSRLRGPVTLSHRRRL